MRRAIGLWLDTQKFREAKPLVPHHVANVVPMRKRRVH
jgi:hypothetical protein